MGARRRDRLSESLGALECLARAGEALLAQVLAQVVEPRLHHGEPGPRERESRVEIDGPLGAGPGGTCIRENRAVVNDDFSVNPRTAPWRTVALRFGFLASAAFPLRRGGQPVAELTLYARDAGAFDAEQVGLLEASGGSVTVERSDSLRESLIGVAPFFVGLGAIILIAGYGFDLWPNSPLTISEMLDRVVSTAGDWLTWVDLYLIFAVSTAMIPSESDREPWGQVLVVFGVIALAAFLLRWTPRLTADMIKVGETVLNGLTFAFGVSVLINGLVAILIWLVEWMVTSITQRRVKY